MLRLLIATSNPGKLREYRQLLHGLCFELVGLIDAGIALKVEEKYDSYAENALHKALSYAGESGLITLADDSGLEVDALGGEPGVKSARYAGKDATDSQRVQFLLRKLHGLTHKERTARFKCVIAICRPQGESGIFYGECTGLITEQPAGAGGFGYDPIFYFEELGKTMAELEPEVKNRVSHRARAAGSARGMLQEIASGET